MAGVFISYHRSEGASTLVRRIDEELKNRGISCWYDTNNPDPGNFAQTIKKEIENCTVFLFIWDAESDQSKWCLREVHEASDCKQPSKIIPFRVGKFAKDSEIYFMLRTLQAFDGGDSLENAPIDGLIQQISGAIGLIPLQSATTPEAKPKAETEPEAKPKTETQSEPKAQPKSKAERVNRTSLSNPYSNDTTGLLVCLIILIPVLFFVSIWLNPPSSGDGWKLSNGVLTLSLEGNMTDYRRYSGSTSSPWDRRRKEIISVVISDSVTSIGNLDSEKFL